MSKLGIMRLKRNVERLVGEGRLQMAVRACEKYLAKHNGDAQAMSLLGLLWVRQKDYTQAITWLSLAWRLNQNDAGIAYNLAKCHVESGNDIEAEQYYRLAIQANPRFVPSYFNLANSLRNRGCFDEAIVLYRQAIVIEPTYSKSYYALSLSKKFVSGDPDIRVMEQFRHDPRFSGQHLMYLLFALAKAYDDIGRYDDAFDCLAGANNLKRAEYHYDISVQGQLFDRVKSVFDQSLLARLSDCGIETSRPVFIVGMPRSGTTLVEQILSSHPEVFGAGEIDDFGEVVMNAVRQVSSADYPDTLLSRNCDDIIASAEDYNARLYSYSADSRYVINKMPGNFLHVALIRLMFPSATVIHCRRDPAATCLSIYKQYFSGRHEYAYDLEELGQYYNMYLDLMAYWYSLLPGYMIDIHYESLIADQRGETERLLDRLGLVWNESCLDFQNNNRAVRTVSVSQVRESMYTDAIAKWTHYKEHLTPLLSILGADTD